MSWADWFQIAFEMREKLICLYPDTYLTIKLRNPASDLQIKNIERIWGYSLPDDYADFLRYSNGLENLDNDFTIFGTDELMPSSELMMSACEVLKYSLFETDPQERTGLLVFMANLHDPNIAYMKARNFSTYEEIIQYYPGEKIGEYGSFTQFVDEILEIDESVLRNGPLIEQWNDRKL